MKQQSLEAPGFEKYRKKTAKEQFLDENGANHPLEGTWRGHSILITQIRRALVESPLV